MIMSLTQYSDVKAQANTLIWYMRLYSAWPYKAAFMVICLHVLSGLRKFISQLEKSELAKEYILTWNMVKGRLRRFKVHNTMFTKTLFKQHISN